MSVAKAFFLMSKSVGQRRRRWSGLILVVGGQYHWSLVFPSQSWIYSRMMYRVMAEYGSTWLSKIMSVNDRRIKAGIEIQNSRVNDVLYDGFIVL
jgi:hypothetical protein